jgi:spore germination cell wall hydrolase CwlJ-like protein
MRAMYFESNRSSPEGMLAVGTVVMNRVGSRGYPKTVCGVVGQKNQFAQGVLYKPMKEKRSVALVASVADQVLAGARHPGVRSAQHFHTAGMRFPYGNMHYVLEAGGNEFYEKY